MSKRFRKTLLISLAVLVLPGIRVMHREINAERGRLGLTHAEPLENAPPALAFTTVALGGFRGLLANFLWTRAVSLQDEGKYFEMISLSDWITKLQPDSGMVWANQAWNLAYNISVQFSDFEDRWLWVRSGMELLRDEGLRYNPRDPLLYRELAWIFQDKIGRYTDFAHRHYKQVWITEMFQLLGSDPHPDALLNPQTEEARRRATILREKYKLDPAWMKHVDEHFGPLDWRMPEAHAIYWADLGLSRCQGGAFETLSLRRVIWQSMQAAFQGGRLIQHRGTNRVDFGPNLDLIPNANRAYDEMERAEPKARDSILRGHKNFLKDAICSLYAADRRRDAAYWFNYARTTFDDVIPGGQDLDQFVVAEVTRALGDANPTRVRLLLEGMVGHYLSARAYGEDDEANGHALLARHIWEFYAAKYARLPNVRMPSLAEMEAEVLARLSPKSPAPKEAGSAENPISKP